MHNSDLHDKYSLILETFDSGFEDEIISVQEDGWGEYVAYAKLYGVNVIFEQDSQGFKYLYTVTDAALDELRDYYAELSESSLDEF